VTSHVDSLDGNSKLWRYNYHYHNDLNSVAADTNYTVCERVVNDWISFNHCSNGEGWEPYCISLRSVNWIKWLSRLQPDQVNPVWNDVLFNQVNILDQRLEYHIQGNHLFANAKALIFAGVYFGGRQGDRWLSKGTQIMMCQMREQFLLDGAHYELSPMYHAILLWDVADVIALYQITRLPMLRPLSQEGCKLCFKGLEWFNDMTHPDQNISFFNDAAFGLAPKKKEVENYMNWLGVELPPKPKHPPIHGRLNKASGYAVINWQDVHKLIFDVAKIGPEYQPGHGHADTLSCELSLFGQRVLVNTGTSTYENGCCRDSERATSSHNTVTLDDENSSDVWKSFRVARRAEPHDVQLLNKGWEVEVTASHNGFKKLFQKRTHKRTLIAKNKLLIIHDSVIGGFDKAQANWHFHPAVKVERINATAFEFKLEGGQVAKCVIEGAVVSLENTCWSREFGLKIPNKKMCLHITGSECVTRISWS